MSIDENAKIAFAGLCHDLGKMTERGRIQDCQPTDGDVQLCCPSFNNAPHTHKHAAWSAKSIDVIEGDLPDIKKLHCAPFTSWATPQGETGDSIINAIGKHHKPDTFLQQIITCADRIASGFERKRYDDYVSTPDAEQDINESQKSHPSHYRARLKPILDDHNQQNYAFDVTPLTGKALFPKKWENKKSQEESQQDYKDLWQSFKDGLHTIPKSQKRNFPLWLSHFDSLYLMHTWCIPSATVKETQPNVSLYDHSKLVSALSVALYQFYKESDKKDAIEKLKHPVNAGNAPFLIIQGDFMGIQDFIFAGTTKTDKNTAKLLRGKSFYVSLLAELAGLRIMDELDLPSTCKMLSAAGKFTIIAGNTKANRQKTNDIAQDISQWFLKTMYGVGNIIISQTSATAADLLCSSNTQNNFSNLMKKLHDDLDIKKHQSHTLHTTAITFDKTYEQFQKLGSCELNSTLPAQCDHDGMKLSHISRDQIVIGDNIVHGNKLVISKMPLNDDDSFANKTLKQTIFGFYISFVDSKKTESLLSQDTIVRVWDFAPADSPDEPLWKNYAKLFISGHVPTVSPDDKHNPHYDGWEGIPESGTKPFNMLSVLDQNIDFNQDNKKTTYGIDALAIVKGDIDNLGNLFQNQSKYYTFAGMAGLSRQIDMFFSVYLPSWLASHKKYKDCYTVFAGGDDFFLIGPWYRMQDLAQDLRQEFSDYICKDSVTFSVGMALCDEKTNIATMGDMGEHALDRAKDYGATYDENGQLKTPLKKNAVCIFDKAVSWTDFKTLKTKENKIFDLNGNLKKGLSTGYIYGMLEFTDMVDSTKPKDAMWLSRHTYRTARYIKDNKISEDNQGAFKLFLDMFKEYKGNSRIPLTNYLYKNRTNSGG